MVLMLASALMVVSLVLVRRGDGLGDGDLRRLRRGAGHRHKGLQVRVGEEVLEVLGGLPLVHDQDEAVADREAVMDAAARRLSLSGHLRELVAVTGQSLAELSHVTLELQGSDDAHDLGPSLESCPARRAADSTGTSPL